jgi:aprataxin
MSKKSRPSVPPKAISRFMPSRLNPRDNLVAYIRNPEDHSCVVYYNDDWVVIKDGYPKSAVHLLLMPRHKEQYNAHPYDAFRNPEFLACAKLELEKVKDIAASELRRMYGHLSATDRPRLDAMNADDPPEVLPEGRDWKVGLRTGIHANPSMNHLHIHCLSPDLHSPSLKKGSHYNSHTTRFLVPLEDFPQDTDEIRDTASVLLRQDLVCWRCGEIFGNKMAKLKEHLAMEFGKWVRE